MPRHVAPPRPFARLADLPDGPVDFSWLDDAACVRADAPLEEYFTVSTAARDRGLALCAACPVIAACDAHRLRHECFTFRSSGTIAGTTGRSPERIARVPVER